MFEAPVKEPFQVNKSKNVPNFTQTFYCKDLFSRTFEKKKD